MILRIVRASVDPGTAVTLVERLRREIVPRLSVADGIGTFAFGIHHADAGDQFLALSTWRDFDAVAAAADGRPEDSIGAPFLVGTLSDVTTGHYELIVPGGVSMPSTDGPVLGVLTGLVRPRSEPHVHATIEAIRPRIEAAGVLALYVGRRLAASGTSDLAVVAVWSDRTRLDEFSKARPEGAIDPEFTAHLLDWQFVVYDCFSLEPATSRN